MEKWRKIWRNGIAPAISTKALTALKRALMTNDPRLVQGATCVPCPVTARPEELVEGACAIALCGWRGEGRITIRELEDYVQAVHEAIDTAFNEPGYSRFFLNWFDDTPREQMRRELLSEVNRSLRSSALVLT